MLGFSQEEIAMLLGVTKGQWSMYDSGERDLPLEAKKQLILLLSHLKNTKEASHQTKKILASEQHKTQEWLRQEQRNLEYKELLLDKQLLSLENKRAKCFAALELVHSLEASGKEFPFDPLKMIKTRLINTLDKHPLHQLQHLKMRKEHLEMLKSSLEQKINKNQNKL